MTARDQVHKVRICRVTELTILLLAAKEERVLLRLPPHFGKLDSPILDGLRFAPAS